MRLAVTAAAQRPLVLVVEDDLAVRTLLQRLLEREGYRTTTATDGEAGLHAIDKHSPDLVLLDVGLPLLDGYEVTRRLRADPRSLTLPIILLTGRSDLDDVVSGLDAGADDFLSKPFRNEELLARIRSALRLRQALGRMDAAHTAVAALANAVEAKDPMTERHCQRLANLAARVGAEVGLPAADLEDVAYGPCSTTSARSGSPSRSFRSPGRSTTTSGSSCAATPRSESGSAGRFTHQSDSPRSSATTTSAGTVAAIPTACAGRRSRLAPASSGSSTPSTR